MNWTLGYNFYNTDVILFNAYDVKVSDVASEISTGKYQIYLVTKRKKLFFDRCEQLKEKNVSWFYFLDENHDKQWLDREHQKDIILCKSEEPGYITVIDKGQSSDIRSHHVVSIMFSYCDVSGDRTLYGNQSDILHPSDLEVIYVGQSFKGIKSRLEKHEKIKEIALRVVEESTTEEVLVVCLAYKAKDNAVAFVTAGTKVDAGVESLLKLRGDAVKRISPKKQLTLFEASLIKYFQPEFNTEYKETFPAAGFTSYDEIYDTEFKYVSMAVAMPDNLCVRLWSQHVQQPAYVHQDHFPLESQEEKKSLFGYLYDQRK